MDKKPSLDLLPVFAEYVRDLSDSSSDEEVDYDDGNRGSLHVSCLPPEVLTRIFRHLSLEDRGQVASVCKKWRDIVYHKSFWSNRMYHIEWWPDEVNDANLLLDALLLWGVRRIGTSDYEGLCRMIESLPDLRGVTFQCFKKLGVNLSSRFVRRMANLTELDLIGIYDVTEDSIKLVAEHLKKLTRLTLAKCYSLTNRSLQYVAMGLPELKQLDLTYCFDISDEGVGYLSGFGLSQPPAKLPQLHHLYLNYCNDCTDLSIRHLSRGQPKIQELYLAGLWSLSDAVFKWLATFSELSHLDISNTDITGCGLVELAIAQSPIAHLQMDDCIYLTDESLGYVGMLKRLRTLVLNLCSFRDSALKWLVKYDDPPIRSLSMCEGLKITRGCVRHVARLKQLHELIFEVDDEGLAHLADAQSPVAIVRCCVSVTNAGARHLARLPNLQSVDLSQSDCITGTGLMAFMARARGPVSELRLHSDFGSCVRLGAGTLTCVARGLPALTSLWLSGSHVDEEGMKAAARLLPRLRALYVNDKNVIEEVRNQYDCHVFQ